MLSLFSLLVVILASITVTRVATVALTLTGLPVETARFQARSAFTGAGFTTSESEALVNHPVRRRILMILMLLGNAGIVTAGSSLILAFVGDGTRTSLWQFSGLAGCVALLWFLASSRLVDRFLTRLIARFLQDATTLGRSDAANLLHLAGDYGINELAVEPGDWLAGRTLAEVRLRDEGVVVLGITRPDGTYVGVPDGQTAIDQGDSLILYARTAALQALDERRQGHLGDAEHATSVAEQLDREDDERAADPRAEQQDEAGRDPRSRLAQQVARWENEGGAIYQPEPALAQ